jgi:hypothetical protein
LSTPGRAGAVAKALALHLGEAIAGAGPVETAESMRRGTSLLHGQVKAVDFVVMQGGRVVAGTSRSTIETDWTAPG